MRAGPGVVSHGGAPGAATRRAWAAFARQCLGVVIVSACAAASGLQVPLDATGLGYTNIFLAGVPWSIHVVRIPRTNGLYEAHSVHAANGALGLDTLSDQVNSMNPAAGTPIAAINGDFYQRDRAYAGAPRGLQVIDGELISGPGNKVSMWIDAMDEAHVGTVMSRFEITWPDETVTPFRLNTERSFNGIALYTPAVGRSTRTGGGRELVLERAEGSPWLPLRVGKTYTAVVREVHETGNTPLSPGALVVSLGPGAARKLTSVGAGAILKISTATSPALHGIKMALSGGPLLIHDGRRQHIESDGSESYESSSMFERHPRAAVGWNQDCFFLFEVDGRQPGLSMGMTLDQLASFMLNFGCQEAMNFDGGGSATLWFDKEVRNSPCDRAEREIANCLVIVRKKNVAVSAGNSARP